MAFDVVVRGGTVVDGTGGPGRAADIGISGERIQAVGDLSAAEGGRTIDASGLTVSPGFIDTHVHSDAALLTDPQHAQGLRQGITTEILGQDGLSYAPLSSENYAIYARYLSGILGMPPLDLDMSTVAAFRSHYDDVGVNTAYLVAHGAVRLEVAGFRDVPLEGGLLDRAKRLVAEGMEQGAVGLATGLSYHPHAWSDTSEIIALCEVVREAGGVYVTHLRDVNTDRAFGGGGIPEALEIGRRSGVKVHFSHHRTHAPTAGQVAQRMALIDEAKAEGLDVTADLYPYPTGSTYPLSYLPSQAHEGGIDGVLDRLRDPVARAEMARDLDENPRERFIDAVFSYLGKDAELEGMSLADIAEARGITGGNALCEVLLEQDGQVCYWGSPPDSVAVWRQVSRDALELLSRPDYMVGSDSVPVGSVPHPRGYGTFPRFLGRLRRQFGTMTLEQTVQRMTDNPARRFNLTDRGRVAEGYFADVVVFDAERIIDNATYDDPKQFPAGIPYVLVNGQVAVGEERCTGVLAGRAIP